jgi:hypothetical protein
VSEPAATGWMGFGSAGICPADHGDSAAPPQAAPASPLAAYLGLYLVLLAFFLHLVAHTVPDAARAQAVAAAVVATAQPTPVLPPAPAVVPHPRLAPVARLLATLALPARTPARAAADRFDLAIASTSLFEPEAAELRAAARPAIAQLTRLLTDPAPPALRLTVLVGVAAATATDATDPGTARAVAAAATLARTLLAEGAPADRFAIGIAPGATGEVRVSVRLEDSDASSAVP